MRLENNALPKLTYIMLKRDTDQNISYNGANWAHQIKSILDQHGFTDLWENQFDTEIPFPAIKQRILDMYHQSWNNDINNSNRLITYCRYKKSFSFETYLNKIPERKHRNALSRFRLSSHKLEIEKGRYTNIPRDERICRLCTQNVIENEYHVLMACPFYRELRTKYLKPYFCRWPTIQKFNALMSTQSRQCLIRLSKFIYCALKLRDN